MPTAIWEAAVITSPKSQEGVTLKITMLITWARTSNANKKSTIHPMTLSLRRHSSLWKSHRVRKKRKTANNATRCLSGRLF